MRIALGGVLGGALGNLLDRLMYGEVTDSWIYTGGRIIGPLSTSQIRALRWP